MNLSPSRSFLPFVTALLTAHFRLLRRGVVSKQPPDAPVARLSGASGRMPVIDASAQAEELRARWPGCAVFLALVDEQSRIHAVAPADSPLPPGGLWQIYYLEGCHPYWSATIAEWECVEFDPPLKDFEYLGGVLRRHPQA